MRTIGMGQPQTRERGLRALAATDDKRPVVGRPISCPNEPLYDTPYQVDAFSAEMEDCFMFVAMDVQWCAYPGLLIPGPPGIASGLFMTRRAGDPRYVTNAYPCYVHRAGPYPSRNPAWANDPRSWSPCAYVRSFKVEIVGGYEVAFRPAYIDGAINMDIGMRIPMLDSRADDEQGGEWVTRVAPYMPCAYMLMIDRNGSYYRVGDDVAEVEIK